MGKDKKSKKHKEHNEEADQIVDQQTADIPESNEGDKPEVERELQEIREKYIRLVAEFDNFRKRTLKEKVDLMSTASRDVVSSLLPVLDDFDRAKKSADDPNSKEVFSEGVALVYNKLYKTLEAKGLKAMESNGETFDPEQHEAITEIPAPTEKLKGKVVDTVEKGYYLKDVIIRYAKVVVGK
jgi:molecular chaperone GrpE